MSKYILSETSWLEHRKDLPTSVPVTLETLWPLCPEKKGTVFLIGKTIETPRFTRSYGSDYTFSGTVSKGHPLPPELLALKEYVDKKYGSPEQGFDEILVNWYENGHHYIGFHSDSEIQLVPNSPIVSVSFGAERKFRIREKHTKRIVLDLPLTDRSVVVMGGTMQKEFTHEVPKIAGKKGEDVGPRVNVTFRQFKA